jgi:hypothetical protein
MVNHQQDAHQQGLGQPSNTNATLPSKPGWRMLSSTELSTVSSVAARNSTSDNKHSNSQNAYASSSKSVLPMHSLIDTAPSPLPLVYQANAETARETPEYVPTGAVVPRGRESATDQSLGSTTASTSLPAVPTDGRTLCVRHQMMADQDVNGKLQKVSYSSEHPASNLV